MTSSIPPINANAHTEIEIEDSCNCCWGRRVKKPPLQRRDAASDLFAAELTMPIRDAQDVYNLSVKVHVDSPKPRKLSHGHRNSHDSPKHTKTSEPIRGTDPDTKT